MVFRSRLFIGPASNRLNAAVFWGLKSKWVIAEPLQESVGAFDTINYWGKTIHYPPLLMGAQLYGFQFKKSPVFLLQMEICFRNIFSTYPRKRKHRTKSLEDKSTTIKGNWAKFKMKRVILCQLHKILKILENF